MKNVIYVILFLSCKVIYSQSGVFVPEELLVQDVVYLKDSSYWVHEDIQFPIIHSYENMLDEQDVMYYLIDNALNGPLETLKPETDTDFPYSALEKREPVEIPQYEEIIIVKDNQEIEAQQLIDYHDHAIGISFIENWKADISKGIFTKEVLGYEIITKEVKYYGDFEDILYDIPFRVFYPDDIKAENTTSCVEVIYEFPLAPMDFYYSLTTGADNNIFVQTNGYYDLPIKNYQGNNYRHAPLLSGFNKRNLVQEILEAVNEGKITAYDFFSNKKLSINEIKTHCTKIDTVQAPYTDPEDLFNSIIKEPFDTNDYNSLIFTEKWFIDTSNGKINKEVKELALVKAYALYDYKLDAMEYKKEIAFKIKFTE